MKRYLLVVAWVGLLLSCSKPTPEYVIEEEKLENLLVDIHISEAVIESNNMTKIPEKKKIREAVFLRHGVTQAQFDTTLVWYGHNMDKYMEIYGRVVDRLKNENEEAKKLLALENSQQMSQAGDSVDVWRWNQYHIFDTRLASNLLTFEIRPDENFKQRDYFELRFKVMLLPRQSIAPQAYISATHRDNNMVFNQLKINKEGWYSLPLQTDSGKVLNLLQGYIVLPVQAVHQQMYIDSLTLIRKHYNEKIPAVTEQKSMKKQSMKFPLKQLTLKK